MVRIEDILLEVWREISRHIEVQESALRIAPLLGQHMPVDLLIVRSVDVRHSCVETIGVGVPAGAHAPEQTRNTTTAEELERLLAWCRRREILRLAADTDRASRHPFLPDGTQGEALVGSLCDDSGPIGLVALVAKPPRTFDAAHPQMLDALLEPFTVAAVNDHSFRDMRAHQEAAEADRRSLLTRLGRQEISEAIVGAESGLLQVMERLRLVAPSDVPVLLFGETGSGKEVIARAIHTRSGRSGGPFLRVNCGAIPPDLIDSELFGHERGSFTGAVSMRKGWFERADGGTLFLDEVGELPPAAQVRLLRILQDGTFERVGGQRQLIVDVRVVAATNQDLQAMVAQGGFREDLWYRLAVFPIRLPALRDRPEDMPALAAHFALRAARRFGLPLMVPTPEDVNLLVAYGWPGNIRELASVIDRAAILGNGKRLEIAKALGVMATPPMPRREEAPAGVTARTARASFAALDVVISEHIKAALRMTQGRIEGPRGAAKLLGINPHTLRARMRKLGIDWRMFRELFRGDEPPAPG